MKQEPSYGADYDNYTPELLHRKQKQLTKQTSNCTMKRKTNIEWIYCDGRKHILFNFLYKVYILQVLKRKIHW